MDKLANIAKLIEVMVDKSINSTEAQNNFGLVLSDMTHNGTRYIVIRHGVPQVVMISFDDLIDMLGNDKECQTLRRVLISLKPEYVLGEVVDGD